LAFLFHTIQELYDQTYIELRSNIGARKRLFETMNVLTSMFTFRSFDKMIECILLSRQSDGGVNLEEFMLIE
jgi:hypothetical protein